MCIYIYVQYLVYAVISGQKLNSMDFIIKAVK